MAKQNTAGCGGWIVAGLLLIGLISQCGDEPTTASTSTTNGLLSASASEPSRPARWLYVQPETLNCRAKPSAASSKIETLDGSALVREVDEEGGWSLLRRSPSDCWVKSSYLGDEPRPVPVRREYRQPAEMRGFVSSGRSTSAYYANCSAARAAAAAPVLRGEPGYSRKLDRDGDGVGCE
ncbi:Excalibur calcium-binding domain protein [compost metagenome]